MTEKEEPSLDQTDLAGQAPVPSMELEDALLPGKGPREPNVIAPHSPVGTVFNMQRFDRPGPDGIAQGCQGAGWFDFPHGGYKHRVENGLQLVRIDKDAPTNGDAGIERHVEVKPHEVYRFTARLRIKEKHGQFKARVNLAARLADGPQLEEFNEAQEEITARPVSIELAAKMPPRAAFISARVKFHTSAPSESGEGEVHSIKLERIE